MKNAPSFLIHEADVQCGRPAAGGTPGLRLLAGCTPAMLKGALSILDQAIVSGTSFLSAAIVGVMSTPSELGMFYLTLSIVQIATALQDSVIWSPYSVYCKRREEADLSGYSGSVCTFSLIFTAIITVMLSMSVAGLSVTFPSTLPPGIWAMIVAAPPILIRFAVRRFAFANLRVNSAIVLDALVAATQLGGLVVIGFTGELSLATIFAVMAGASGAACLGTLVFYRPNLQVRRDRLAHDWHTTGTRTGPLPVGRCVVLSWAIRRPS
jgi:hypothetical protein